MYYKSMVLKLLPESYLGSTAKMKLFAKTAKRQKYSTIDVWQSPKYSCVPHFDTIEAAYSELCHTFKSVFV